MEATSIDLSEEIFPEMAKAPGSLELEFEHKIEHHDNKQRWLCLFLISVVAMGRYFCFGMPQALQSSFYDKFQIDAVDFNLFFTIYAIPNFILPLIGGYLCDTLGIKKSFYIFSLFVIIGNGLFWYGCVRASFAIALFGRFLFGIGGECILVLRIPMTLRWFHEDELGFAGGLSVLAWRLASVLNSIITTKLAESTGDIKVPTFVGFSFCILSLVAGAWFLYIDEYHELKKYGRLSTFDPRKSRDSQKIKFGSILHFEGITWVTATLAIFGVAVSLSYLNLQNNFMEKEYNFTIGSAGEMMALFYLFTGILNPIFGRISDKSKNKIGLLQISFGFLILSFLSLLILPTYLGYIDDTISLFLMSIFIGMFSGVYYPLLPHLEDKKHLGMIMGVVGVICNIGEGLLPLVIGVIAENTESEWDGYYWVIVFELIMASLGFGWTFVLKKLDSVSHRFRPVVHLEYKAY